MRKIATAFGLGLTALTLGLAGCTKPATNGGPEAAPATADSHEGHDHGEHLHPSEGPHHGDLVELGNQEYHAEIVHDDQAGTVTVYVLDVAATNQMPIEATEITINAKHDGQPEQFPLAASPDENDPAGQSSRFVSEDQELAAHLHEKGAEPRLVLTINGKSYRGEITHDHGHEHGHEHTHEETDGHEHE